jgi:hypothetical protein
LIQSGERREAQRLALRLDEALQADLAGRGHDVLRRRVEGLAEANRRRWLGQDGLQQSPALDQRDRALVVPVIERHVEEEEQDPLGTRVVEGVLQALKSVSPRSLSLPTSPSSQPGRSFMPSSARTRPGIFELHSRRCG